VHLSKYIFNLGSCLLSITIDDEMMEEHLEIKLHSNENIEWHCMQLEFNSNLIDFNPDSMEFKFLNW
jgi:hypothetical protein